MPVEAAGLQVVLAADAAVVLHGEDLMTTSAERASLGWLHG
jgi:hypothetical protein